MSIKIEQLHDIASDKHLKIFPDFQKIEEKLRKSPIHLAVSKNRPAGQIFTLTGPRQVGKSTLLKMIGLAFYEKKKIGGYWLDVSVLISPKELKLELEKLIETEREGVLLIDEVSTIPDWQLAFRALHAEGRLDRWLTICTGSNSKGILDSSERLPGRKGGGGDLHLFPQKFFQFIEDKFPDLQEEMDHQYRRGLFDYSNEFLTKGKYPEQLDDLWRTYLICGGFPIPREEYHRAGTLSDETFDVYRDWLFGEWNKVRTDAKSLRSVSHNLVANIGKLSSWESFKKNSDIQSHSTIKSLIEIHQFAFSLSVLSKIDPDKKIFLNAKQKKIMPVDPFISHVFLGISKGITHHFFDFIQEQLANKDYLAKLAELAIVAQLHQYNSIPDLGYLYSSVTKSEIDCSFMDNGRVYGIEIKSGDRSVTRHQRELLKKTDRYFIVGLAREAISPPLFAWLIGKSMK